MADTHPHPPTADTDARAALSRRLASAGRVHRLRAAGRGVVAFGVALLVGQAALLGWVCAARPELLPRVPTLASAALAVLGVAAAAATVFALLPRGGRAADAGVAGAAESRLPALGRGLSTSVEVEAERVRHAAVPGGLREALAGDAAERVREEEAAGGWSRFVDADGLAAWAATAAAVVLAQAVLLAGTASSVATLRPLAAATPASFEPPRAEAAPADPPAEEQPPATGSLTLTEPQEDRWVTRIEAVPIDFDAASSAGIEDLALVLHHNGEETRLPVDPASLPAGVASGGAEAWLDEIELEDYDLVALHVEGRLPASSPGVVRPLVTSGLAFLQVRPFNEDILFRPLAAGEGDPCLKVLMWMIEEERRLVRGAWLLQPGSGLAPGGERHAGVAERLAADHLQLRGVLTEARELFVGSPTTTPPMLLGLDAAGDAMDAADAELAAGRFAGALPRQRAALSALLGVLREFEKAYGRFLEGLEPPPPPAGNPPPAGEKPDLPSGTTLADRQLMRDDLSALDFEMAEVAEAQAKLDWDRTQREEKERTAWRTHDVPEPPESDPGMPPDAPAGEKDAGPQPPPSSSAHPASATAGSGSGSGASDAPGDPNADEPPAADTEIDTDLTEQADRQRALADRLDAAAEDAVTGEAVRRALADAGEAMRARANALDAAGEGEGTAAGSPSQDAGDPAALLDTARDRRDAELEEAHLRRIDTLMKRVAEDAAAGAPGDGPGDTGSGGSGSGSAADAADALARATAARQPPGGGRPPRPGEDGFEERKAAAAEALAEAAEALRSDADADTDASPDAALRALAEAESRLRGGEAQLERLERQLQRIEEQVAARAEDDRPAAEPTRAQRAWEEALAPLARTLDARLVQALPPAPGPPSAGGSAGGPVGGSSTGSLDLSSALLEEPAADPARPAPDASAAGAAHGAAAEPVNRPGADAFQRWEPGLLAVRGALDAVRAELRRTRPRDPLATAPRGEAPAAYRELVDRYFETLSRDAATLP